MRTFPILAFILLMGALAKAQTKNFIDQPYIEVSGTADTMVTPNEIYISIVLSEKDTRDRVSIEELEQKLVATLKGLGLNTEKDLTTSDITSNFKLYLFKGKDVVKTKTYSLKVIDALTATQVFIKLEEIGISNTSIQKVNHTDLDNLENNMRTKAMNNAKERAIALTRSLNQTIGPAIQIQDSENLSQKLQGRVAGLNITRQNARLSDRFDDLPNIEFEKIKVTANINVKFILK